MGSANTSLVIGVMSFVFGGLFIAGLFAIISMCICGIRNYLYPAPLHTDHCRTLRNATSSPDKIGFLVHLIPNNGTSPMEYLGTGALIGIAFSNPYNDSKNTKDLSTSQQIIFYYWNYRPKGYKTLSIPTTPMQTSDGLNIIDTQNIDDAIHKVRNDIIILQSVLANIPSYDIFKKDEEIQKLVNSFIEIICQNITIINNSAISYQASSRSNFSKYWEQAVYLTYELKGTVYGIPSFAPFKNNTKKHLTTLTCPLSLEQHNFSWTDIKLSENLDLSFIVPHLIHIAPSGISEEVLSLPRGEKTMDSEIQQCIYSHDLITGKYVQDAIPSCAYSTKTVAGKIFDDAFCTTQTSLNQKFSELPTQKLEELSENSITEHTVLENTPI